MENNNNGNYGSGSHSHHDKHDHNSHDENRSMSSMSSDMDPGTGSNERQQGMGSRGNDLNDALMSDDVTGWGSDSARMNGSNDGSNNETWDSTGRDTYSSRQQYSGGAIGDESGEESMRMSSDNDDFNQSGFEDDDDTKQAWRDKIRSDDSRTFNEDEPTWKEEKRMSGMNDDKDKAQNENEGGSGADYGSRNAGTSNNNWDANDQMQRGNGLHDDEEDKNSAY